MTATAPLMTLQDVADELGVDPRTVRRWIADGLIPAYRLGPQRLRFRRSEVEAFIDASVVPTDSGEQS